MRAIVLRSPGGLDKLEPAELPDPAPGPGEILVQWHANTLNYHDLVVVEGVKKAQDKLIPMSDGAGIILETGENVTQWQKGDRVMSLFYPNWQEGKPSLEKTAAMPGDTIHGCAVEMSSVPATAVTAIPEGYSFAEAATLPCAALTAWRGLMVESNLKAGDSVLVEGTGGMSIFGLQLAKAAGAFVYATSSSDEKMEKLKALGADQVINYKTDVNWGKTVYKLSGGGVDHVLDAGGGATLKQSVAALKCGGTISLIGVLDSPLAEILLPHVFAKQARLQGLAVGSAEMQNAMVNAININNIKPVLDRSFPLEQLAEAFRYQKSGGHFGKIVIDLSST